ncbi:hypothetical protein WDZ92_00860 [Nostoc sp. NIES-2111]
MRKVVFLLSIIIILLQGGCLSNRDYPQPAVPGDTTNPTHPSGDSISAGSLLISEFIAKACPSSQVPCVPDNYAATVSVNGKWFELYNPTTKDIRLEAGHWFFTDSLGGPTKWPVVDTGFFVPAKGYAIVCTDNGNKAEIVNGKVVFHTSFSLSSGSGDIGVFYTKTVSGTPILVDGISYAPGSDKVPSYDGNIRNKSWGRVNGTASLLMGMSVPTPGAPNQP